MILDELAFELVLLLFSPDLCLEVSDQIVPLEQVFLEEIFDLTRELLRIILAVVESILHKVAQLLVVVAGIVHISRPLGIVETSHRLAQESWFLHGLSFSLLPVLLLKVSVLLLVHLLLTESLAMHVVVAYINRCVELGIAWQICWAVH